MSELPRDAGNGMLDNEFDANIKAVWIYDQHLKNLTYEQIVRVLTRINNIAAK